ncbi:hypothetical protein SAMN04515672_4311 [Natronorubrum texcoconense]|uniref:Uncharacterized protein n=1 Tax=Natronorubrum texcoconense TaxID=1095776 RepID=A0A1G9FW26_9EURY|nr:hypothetical protein SAMN04515672_4311 [Natronorubrum texcoconense]
MVICSIAIRVVGWFLVSFRTRPAPDVRRCYPPHRGRDVETDRRRRRRTRQRVHSRTTRDRSASRVTGSAPSCSQDGDRTRARNEGSRRYQAGSPGQAPSEDERKVEALCTLLSLRFGTGQETERSTPAVDSRLTATAVRSRRCRRTSRGPSRSSAPRASCSRRRWGSSRSSSGVSLLPRRTSRAARSR